MRQDTGQASREDQEPGYKNMRVWEKSFELAVAVFKIADRIPEALGLTLNGQIRITALSVPSQIARSQSNISNRDYLRGLCLAQNSLAEMENQVQLCEELGYASELEVRRVGGQIREVRRMVSIVIGKLRAVVNEGRSLQTLSEEIAALISNGNALPAGSRS